MTRTPHNLYTHILGAVMLLATCCSAVAQQSSAPIARHIDREFDSDARPFPLNPSEVLQKLIHAESEMRQALNQYSFIRDVVIEQVGPNGEVEGTYQRRSRFILDDKGNRIERVVYRPRSTLRGIKISKEDIQDLAGSQFLGLDYGEATKYRLSFAGIETIDGRSGLAVDITPAKKPDPHQMRNRFFVGRVWLDPETHQIFLVRGHTEPQGKQRFPRFETRREVRSAAQLFPSSTFADDYLHFPNKTFRYRMRVRYYDYRRFGSTVTLFEVNEP